MTKRIIVPTEDTNGLNTAVAQHFGRAPYFTVVELDDNGNVTNVKAVENNGEHAGGVGQAHDNIIALQPDAIVAYGMGPRGLISFANAGIQVLKATADTVAEIVAAYKEGKLLALTDGCQHAHHQ